MKYFLIFKHVASKFVTALDLSNTMLFVNFTSNVKEEYLTNIPEITLCLNVYLLLSYTFYLKNRL